VAQTIALLLVQEHPDAMPLTVACLASTLLMQEHPDASYTLTEAQMLPEGCGDTDPEVCVM
jgi:hypothetical protein